MNRRVLRRAPLVAAALLVCLCGGVWLWLDAEAGWDAGSSSLAAEWRNRLNQYADPEAAVAADPAVVVRRFKNGEWVFGLGRDSHAGWRHGGGTLVVRDSTGRTRAFFGHVCGEGEIGTHMGPPQATLAEYYQRLEAFGMTEYPLPTEVGVAK